MPSQVRTILSIITDEDINSPRRLKAYFQKLQLLHVLGRNGICRLSTSEILKPLRDALVNCPQVDNLLLIESSKDDLHSSVDRMLKIDEDCARKAWKRAMEDIPPARNHQNRLAMAVTLTMSLAETPYNQRICQLYETLFSILGGSYDQRLAEALCPEDPIADRDLFYCTLKGQHTGRIPYYLLLCLTVYLALWAINPQGNDPRQQVTQRWMQYLNVNRGNPGALSKPGLEPIFSRARGNRDPASIFPSPSGYIAPRILEPLVDTAFSDGCAIHAICGRPGMGKTELARSFARQRCSRGDYDTVLWTTYSGGSLRETVLQLPGHSIPVTGDRYQQMLQLLRETGQPCLLVIDNYDNPRNFFRELSIENPVYQDLAACGCHILLTSRLDLSGCAYLRHTELQPLGEAELLRLFDSHYRGTGTPDRALLRHLLIDRLRENTYLVTLAAALTQTVSLEDLVQSFDSMQVTELDDPILGRKQERASLMEHAKKLMDLSRMTDDPQKLRLLRLLALLPAGGMPYGMFFQQAFPDKAERQTMKGVSHILAERFWLFIRNQTLSLHPLVRELIADSMDASSLPDITPYIRSLTKLLCPENYTENMAQGLYWAAAAWEVLMRQKLNCPETAMLLSHMAADYDILQDRERTAIYGRYALKQRGLLQGQDLAACLNMVGYALLHTEAELRDTGRNALEDARQILLRLLAENPEDRGLILLCAKNQGNLAAYCLTQGAYAQALELHQETLALRQELLRRDPSPELYALVGAAYRGVGTDHFYLSRQADPAEHLAQSVENHRLSAQQYQRAFGPDHLDAVISRIRMVGSGIRLMEVRGVRGEELDTYLRLMAQAAAFFQSDASADREVKNCLNNVDRLTKLMAQNRLASRERRKLAQKAADCIAQVQSLPEELRCLAGKIHSFCQNEKN